MGNKPGGELYVREILQKANAKFVAKAKEAVKHALYKLVE